MAMQLAEVLGISVGGGQAVGWGHRFHRVQFRGQAAAE